MSTEKSRSAKPSRASSGGPRRAQSTLAASAAPLPKAIGKYTVLARIGQGAMGIVYKCSQPGLNRPVAVKVLTSSKHSLADVLPRFQREARAASRLNHPSVVQVYDIGTEGDLHYIVMEYVEGWSLDKLIGAPGLTVDYTLRLLVHIARALQSAHEAGIVHRDIKPSNILVHKSGLPKLADFGLAKSLHDGTTLSRSGDILGTPRYMSPEQVLMSPKELDARTDVYSLGAVMYEMLTGKPPVDGPNVMAMLRSLTDDEVTPVRQRNGQVPETVAAICQKALAKEREKRYASAGAMAEAMQSYLLEKLLGNPLGAPGKANGDAWVELTGDPRNNGDRRQRTSLVGRALRLALFPLRTWRRAAFVSLLVAGLIGVNFTTGWPEKWIANYWHGLHDIGSAPSSPPQGGTAAASLIAKARDDLDETLSVRAGAPPRERYQALVNDLTAALKRSPNKSDVRWLRARAYRLGGEHLAAIDDLNAFLRQQPGHEAARYERLLATYQLHVLYLNNFSDRVLRPSSRERVREDGEILTKSDQPVMQYAAKLIDALARHDYAAAAQLAESGGPSGVPAEQIGDLAMLQADALFHAAAQSLSAELRVPDSEKAAHRLRREQVAQKAGQALRRGLNADSNHVGLLFLLANSFSRRADWEGADSGDRDRFLRRYRDELDTTLDRLRDATLRHGPDTAIARTVLWTNLGRQDMALDQVKDALSDGNRVRHLYTVKAWLNIGSQPDGVLTPGEVGRILRELQPAFETPPESFNPYFVRALLTAAAGNWSDARDDLQQCKRWLPEGEVPSDNPVHNNWCARANASPTEFLDYTQTVLETLPLMPDIRIRLGEEVVRNLLDPEIIKRDDINTDMARFKMGQTLFRLARLFAEKKDRAKVLIHARGALEQKLPNVTPKAFREDGAFVEFESDDEFQKLLKEFEQMQQQ
jgi:serine/threonine protein kinase